MHGCRESHARSPLAVVIERVKKLARRVTWPTVVLVLAGGAMFLAIVYTAPPDGRELLLGGSGLIATLVGIWIRSPREGHADGSVS